MPSFGKRARRYRAQLLGEEPEEDTLAEEINELCTCSYKTRLYGECVRCVGARCVIRFAAHNVRAAQLLPAFSVHSNRCSTGVCMQYANCSFCRFHCMRLSRHVVSVALCPEHETTHGDTNAKRATHARVLLRCKVFHSFRFCRLALWQRVRRNGPLSTHSETLCRWQRPFSSLDR